jgi:hypoxia up-regulated 1
LILIGKQTLEESRSKLQLIKEKEREKRKKAAAINNLEAFIFDTRDRLSQDDFVKCSSDDEREQISAKLSEADSWLMDADNNVETKVLFNKSISIII